MKIRQHKIAIQSRIQYQLHHRMHLPVKAENNWFDDFWGNLEKKQAVRQLVETVVIEYRVARKKDDVVVLKTYDLDAAVFAIEKAKSQKKASLYLLED